MTEAALRQELAEAREVIRTLQEELAETNRGLVALTLELEQRVDARTAELREAHAELAKTNSELVQLTLELENRVALRTAELQEKNEELRAMSQQLWQAAKLATVGELAASIAHELNNPLATISLRVEDLLAQVPESGPRHRALAIVAQEVERMSQLVANLLQFSRKGQAQISTLDVRDEINKALELIGHHFRNRRITVVRDYAHEVELIQADRQQLRQLLLNLLTNASDAMERGGTLTLRVAPATLESGSTGVEVEVADTGVGIAAEHLPRVLEPFFTTKGEGKGTGLGLAICRRIVQEHQGTLDITSRVGEGTSVRIVFPVSNSNSINLRIV